MSGRKHHHVPQLLQRAFGTRSKKATQVWVYSKDCPPFSTSTANFGAERDFYTDGSDNYVDEIITDFEGEIQGFIQALRSGDTAALEDRTSISRILAHLEMRSKFIREEMMLLSDTLFTELERYLSNPKNAARYLKKALADNPETIKEIIDDPRITDDQRPLVAAWLDTNLETFIENQTSGAKTQMPLFFAALTNRIDESIKKSHLKALKKDIREINRGKAYLELNYRAVHFTEPSLILPDTMVVFVKKGGRITPFLDKSDRVDEVIFPISTHTVVHGYRKSPIERDAITLNRILASCAAKNFVAPTHDAKTLSLATRIGNNAQMVPRTEMRKTIREAVEKF